MVTGIIPVLLEAGKSISLAKAVVLVQLVWGIDLFEHAQYRYSLEILSIM